MIKWNRLRFLGTVMACCIFLGSTFIISAQNLLINADGETNLLSGWVDVDGAWGVSAEITPHSGKGFIWPLLKDLPQTQIYQEVSLNPFQPEISLGKLSFHLTGWLANWDQYPHDQATLAIQGLDAAGQQVFYSQRAHRNPVWAEYTLEGVIPANTATLRVYLIATRFVGTDNDAYFDDISLVVDANASKATILLSPVGNLAQVAVGGTLQLTAQTVGGTDHAYEWSSSFTAQMTVDTNGLVTASKAGNTTIQAVGLDTGAIGTLVVVSYNPQDVVYTRPLAGDQWEAGTSQEITWAVKGAIGSSTCYYRLSPTNAWAPIAAIEDASVQSLQWTTPTLEEPANHVSLRMTWSGGESISPEFTLVPGPLAPELGISMTPITAQRTAVISLRGRIGHSYNLQASNAANGGSWTNVAQLSLTSPNTNWVSDLPATEPGRYFRAILAPQE